MFRALTFWLPMLPGLWYSRPFLRHLKSSSASAAS
jgi:hypothetical protein